MEPQRAEPDLPASIGRRLRALRTRTGRSLASVAQEMGISASALSQIETGAMQPSVHRLVELVGVLGAPVSVIFDDHAVAAVPDPDAPGELNEPVPGVFVARVGAETTARLGGGVTYRRLTPVPISGVEHFESTYPPGASSSVDGGLLVHVGYESGLVVTGTLTFEFADGEVELGPGESLSFAASRPHRVANRTDSVAVATWLTVVGSTGPVDGPTGR
ncbi:helix-turn-helix domain-containing protein [Microbacterium oleivorans]|uniref:Helix-turn-helix domain-containing protein n=1 Tax=Microbacterium oleivorans TaxID=273677 RepID=A0A7D5EVE8_9MICO|nr:helix-turn-helix domain-containing protein [Microbacterium oleivorans]QLD11772.1 helix-turn-helix domain-containing protein [Microbacterium oleivorans]